MKKQRYSGMLKILAIILLIPILHGGLLAGETIETEEARVRLISEAERIAPGHPFLVAVHFKLQPKWHIYWRNAGDAGLAPIIKWELPEGFSAGEILWPYPHRVPFGEFVNFGYEDETQFLVEITPPKNLTIDRPVTLKAQVDYLICKDICIPQNGSVSLELPVSGQSMPNVEMVARFARARSELPLPQAGWEVEAGIQDTTLNILVRAPQWFTGEIKTLEFFPYEEDYLHNAGNQKTEILEDSWLLKVPLSGMRDADPEKISGVLVSDSGWRGSGSEKGLAIEADVRADFEVPSASANWGDLLFAIGGAIAGGIILNLMPCVLPVLSIKILGFVQQAGEDSRESFKHGLTFALGVLVSFWVLAGALLLLRAGGEQLGWGFQLQSPTFLIILSIFLFLFGLNLFGVFEVGTSLTSVGQGSASKSGHFGSFMTGVTATVVATPCTAPFMGTALGYAISQPAWVSMLIFTALGAGMALPYVILASAPGLLKFVPKPGPWMESLKQFMGFLLMATVIWLAWVLGVQAGTDAVINLMVTLLIISFGAWVLGRWGDFTKTKTVRLTAWIIAIAVILIGSGYSLPIWNGIDNLDAEVSNTAAGLAIDGAVQQGKLSWEPYSAELVASLRREGKPVFIDFTAKWCISCQWNKKVALGNASVQNKFLETGVTPVIADWTKRDERITRALAEFGRNSVPLYVLYSGDRNQEPVILPEVLTPGIVLDALDKLSSAKNKSAAE